jgi:hypothetical protein
MDDQLRELENRGNNTLTYVFAILVILLLASYLYTQYNETKEKVKLANSPADEQTKELVILADSIKTGSTTVVDAVDEGDVNSGLSASLESHLDVVEKTL